MEKTDTRKLSPETQEQLRLQAIRLRKSGKKYKEIAEIVGAHHTTVCTWCKAYEREGLKGIKAQKRGRAYGSKRTLSPEQEKLVQKNITDKCPDQLKLPFALWTRRAVKLLIKQLFNIDMPIRSVGEYLNRWGFTPQKPTRRAYEQNPKAVKQWLDYEYPAIAKKAKKENAEIHWGDEAGLRNDSQHGRSYSPKGKTPVVDLPAKRVSINMISSITNQGKVRFMIYEETMNANILIRFMKRLIKDSDKKVFLILDNLRTHHCKPVKEWLKTNIEKIEVFYLPSYSPELNPDEYLNCDLKAGVHSKTPARTKSDLKTKAFSHLKMLQKKPSRVKKYFKNKYIAYAA